MGWVTLHSVAALYPERPSEHEIALIRTWMDCFAKSIVCPSCQSHFTNMLETYRAGRPQLFTSRNELMLFVLRAHNTVNRRLNKKVYTLEESWKILESWSQAYCTWERNRYLRHIQLQWAAQVSMQGIVALTYVKQLVAAESGYWSTRGLNWSAVKTGLPDVSDKVMVPIVDPHPKRSPTDIPFDPIQVLSTGQPKPFKFRAPKIPFSLISK